MFKMRRPSGEYTITVVDDKAIAFKINDDPFVYRLNPEIFNRFVSQYKV